MVSWVGSPAQGAGRSKVSDGPWGQFFRTNAQRSEHRGPPPRHPGFVSRTSVIGRTVSPLTRPIGHPLPPQGGRGTRRMPARLGTRCSPPSTPRGTAALAPSPATRSPVNRAEVAAGEGWGEGEGAAWFFGLTHRAHTKRVAAAGCDSNALPAVGPGRSRSCVCPSPRLSPDEYPAERTQRSAPPPPGICFADVSHWLHGEPPHPACRPPSPPAGGGEGPADCLRASAHALHAPRSTHPALAAHSLLLYFPLLPSLGRRPDPTDLASLGERDLRLTPRLRRARAPSPAKQPPVNRAHVAAGEGWGEGKMAAWVHSGRRFQHAPLNPLTRPTGRRTTGFQPVGPRAH